jgi:hypothetical protein
MKIQDIQKDSKFDEITYASGYVTGVAGYAGAYNSHIRNVTKRVKSIKEDTIVQYNGAVKTFRKFIELEDGNIIRMYWGAKGNDPKEVRYYSNWVWRDAL